MFTFLYTIQHEIEFLGQRHVRDGVSPEHDQLAGSALIDTLKSILGDLWNPETEEAWRSLYETMYDIW